MTLQMMETEKAKEERTGGEGRRTEASRTGLVPEGEDYRNWRLLHPTHRIQRQAREAEGLLDSMEYRAAFAEYVRTGNDLSLHSLKDVRMQPLLTTDVGRSFQTPS